MNKILSTSTFGLRSRAFSCAVFLLFIAESAAQSASLVDHHQHLFRPVPSGETSSVPTVTATDLVKMLDQAKIQRAVVLSVAYQSSNPNKPPMRDEFERVKAENDWTSQEVARYPNRLRGFCSVNPLKNYALQELTRCARDQQLRVGLKLHFGNSDVLLDDPAHIASLREVFRAANSNQMAVVVHMRPSISKGRPYGAAQALKFLTEVLPAAPDIPIQIAHLGGAGGYDDPAIDQALKVFVDAIRKDDSRMARVYFDVSGVAGLGRWEEKAEQIATRIRELGIHRILYGSDGAVARNSPAEALAAFRRLPLTKAEFQTIESNVAPYMR